MKLFCAPHKNYVNSPGLHNNLTKWRLLFSHLCLERKRSREPKLFVQNPKGQRQGLAGFRTCTLVAVSRRPGSEEHTAQLHPFTREHTFSLLSSFHLLGWVDSTHPKLDSFLLGFLIPTPHLGPKIESQGDSEAEAELWVEQLGRHTDFLGHLAITPPPPQAW